MPIAPAHEAADEGAVAEDGICEPEAQGERDGDRGAP
jgi:hypothetical protein